MADAIAKQCRWRSYFMQAWRDAARDYPTLASDFKKTVGASYERVLAGGSMLAALTTFKDRVNLALAQSSSRTTPLSLAIRTSRTERYLMSATKDGNGIVLNPSFFASWGSCLLASFSVITVNEELYVNRDAPVRAGEKPKEYNCKLVLQHAQTL
jgi:hypothetical protein